MLQKLVTAILALTILGAIGLGLYDSTRSDDAETEVLRAEITPTVIPITLTTATTVPTIEPTPLEVADVQPTPVQEQASVDMLGEAWQGGGTVAALDDVGLTLEDGTYVELAPSFYWADIPIIVGDIVAINGFANGDQIHTQTLSLNGETYTFRTAEGQPLWSGGAENGQGGGNTQQVSIADWETYIGTLTSVTNNSLILQTNDGQTIPLQLGQPRFRDSQNIVLANGDLVEVSGYWQGDQFRVGTLTKTTTQETLLLLDPNGRPLWGGPGRNGESGGGGQGNSGNGNQGNGNQGGRNNATTEAGQ